MLSATHEQRAQQARGERARRIEEAGARFEVPSRTLARQMIELSETVQRLAEATVDRSTIAGDRAASVASATVQTRESMTLLAERGGGLARAFAEIEHSLIGSRSTAEIAVGRVIVGGNRARGLMDAAQSIDDVMTLIGNIAGTVNLLALNAAIEAARAGEAELGFGVVAREIKNLSIQTHDATLAIASKVDALRTDVVDVANDYVEIETAISSMAFAGAKIDDAIVRETATTRLIAASVSEASTATHAIEDAARTIAQSASSASSSARDLDRIANELRRGATALGAGVSDLLAELRAA
jgi:methyl-accepting chemotaxis protein